MVSLKSVMLLLLALLFIAVGGYLFHNGSEEAPVELSVPAALPDTAARPPAETGP